MYFILIVLEVDILHITQGDYFIKERSLFQNLIF